MPTTNRPNKPTGNRAKVSISKHRPVLTAAQISHIILLCKLEDPLTEISMSIISYLAPFLSKIENSGNIPAYITTSRTPAHNSLEGLGEQIDSGIEAMHLTTKKERWAKAYAIYILDRASCNLQQLQDAREHMYLNDLMTETEVLEFEAGIIGKREAN